MSDGFRYLERSQSPITDVTTQVALTAKPFSENKEPFLPTIKDAAPLSPIPEEPPAHTYPESGRVSFALDEATTQSESSGLIPGPLPEFGSQSTEDPLSAESSQMQEFEPEELGSTSPPKEFLIAEAPAFHGASAVSNTDLREGSLSMDDGATKHDDLPVSIPVSSSLLAELPASNTEFPPQPDLLVPAVQPEASFPMVEVEVVSDSRNQSSYQPISTLPRLNLSFQLHCRLLLFQSLMSTSKRKSDHCKVTSVGKNALKSFKGVFGYG